MFVNIDYNGFFPTEYKISQSCANNDRDCKISVVRHEYEHERVTDSNLNQMEKGLQPV